MVTDNGASRVLEQLGVNLSQGHTETGSRLPKSDNHSKPRMQLPLMARRAIDLSYRESRDLDKEYVGT